MIFFLSIWNSVKSKVKNKRDVGNTNNNIKDGCNSRE